MKIEPTSTECLVRDGDSGIYYARTKIKGRIYLRSLETKAAKTAKLRLPEKLKEIREQAPSETVSHLEAKATFRDIAALYAQQVRSNPRLQPATREARLRPLALLGRTWPELFDWEIRRITPVSIKNYIDDFERGKWPYLPHRAKSKAVAGNSPSTFNKLVTCLRESFELAVKSHVIGKNPAAGLTYKPLRKKLLQLPNKTQFAHIVSHIRMRAGKGRIAGDLVEGLAYSGLRLEEAGALLWEDLDHERGMMTVRGTKTEGSARTVPMTPAFQTLTARMKIHREQKFTDDTPTRGRVFQASEATLSLANACRAVGVKKLTHHDLRHLFATTCIESGVDIPTVANWLGHSDGGGLAMKVYGHIRPSHSTEAAKRVSFG